MSKLSGKLLRRRDRQGNAEQPVDSFGSNLLDSKSETLHLSGESGGSHEPVEAGQTELPVENQATTETGGDKSTIIAQLQRQVQKLERQKIKAFGSKNKPRVVDYSPAFVPATSQSGAASWMKSAMRGSSKPVENELTVHREALLPGQVLDTSLGEVWLNRKEFLAYCHGRAAVNRYLGVGASLAAFAKDERLADLNPKDALFIDTETTGLSGGAGTLPFLIGAGFFEHDVFVVEQYFCREPSEEPAQLEALAQRLAAAKYLVSFNGKSFDMPLINTRYILNQMKNPGYNLPHLDLLHVSRRIFKRRLTDRSLQNLEKVLLGFVREGDIPGAMIPEVYRDFLFGHGEDGIAAILEHNLLDIVALAALGGMLDDIYRDPTAVAHAADHLGLAKEAFGAGALEIGDQHLDAMDNIGAGDDRRVALHMKAREVLRRKQYGDAVELYHRVLEVDACDLDAHLQLTKLYEHRLKNMDLAIHHARAAEALEGADASERRILRLEKKKGKHATPKW